MNYLNKILDEREYKLRDASKKAYIRNFELLYKKFNPNTKMPDNVTAFSFLDDKNKVMSYLNTLSKSVKKNRMNAILVFLNGIHKYKYLLGFYKKKYHEHQITVKPKPGEKNDKELSNWIEWDDILKIKKKLKKQVNAMGYRFNKIEKVKNTKEWNLLRNYLLLSLYTELPPRRTEYLNMKVIDKKDYDKLTEEEKNNNNYLVNINSKNKFFHYGKNSVKSQEKDDVKIEIPKNLNSVLNFWFKNIIGDWLMPTYKGDKITDTSRLSKIFKEIFNKNVSVAMLRKIYLSHHFADAHKKQAETAKLMNHSTDVQDQYYIKN